MNVFFMFCSVLVLCLISFTDCRALTANEALRVALAENLILSTADFDKHIEQNPPLFNRDLCLAVIYNKTGLKPLWVSETGPSSRAAVIWDFLKRSDDEGLDSQRYDIDEITSLWPTKVPASLARLDTLLTYNLVKYIHDINFGRIRPALSNFSEFSDGEEINFDVVAAVNSALNTPDLKAYLTSLAPAHHYYRDLKAALSVYRAIASSGGWQHIPQGKTIHPGEKDARLSYICKRLVSPGISPILPPENNVYSPDLQKAVKRFQWLNGIDSDGVIGPNTLAVMNIPVSRLVEQIIVNMARWRWQAHVLGDKYVMINIANYNLTAFNNHVMVLNFPVIIGQLQHQTPVFSDSIKYIEFNPFWNITPGIAKNEELPNLRKNPRYLVDRHVRLFDGWEAGAIELDSTKMDWQKITRARIASFRLRQDPGPWNALGRIKFGFPNKYSIYMHDTPTKDLFSRNKRDFSHGCIRLSNPLALAIFALQDQGRGWTKEKVESYYYSDKRMIIRLKPPLPVHITYQTTWVDKDGLIHFNRDIYARDEKLYKALMNSNDKIAMAIHKIRIDTSDKFNR
jgi:L,D-transpeptidase YcbB